MNFKDLYLNFCRMNFYICFKWQIDSLPLNLRIHIVTLMGGAASYHHGSCLHRRLNKALYPSIAVANYLLCPLSKHLGVSLSVHCLVGGHEISLREGVCFGKGSIATGGGT